MDLLSYYKNKKVLVTGHTGFKGSWLCLVLKELGASVYGFSLEPPTFPALYSILDVDKQICSTQGDVRDFISLEKAYIASKPDVVIHLAAQPIVRDSYKNPKYTYETNVLGTVNILECLRKHPGAKSLINVTTDKVYENNDLKNHAFKENEKLDGYDPYSNSKSCSELVTHSYKNSFFDRDISPAISTARAGNVIGGGDFSNDRIIPDCVRAVINDKDILVRNPFSIRPYQHVLEPLFAYLMVAMQQDEKKEFAGYYNIGPREEDCITTGSLVDSFVKYWGSGANWISNNELNAPHEASFLKLDCSKMREVFGWEPIWNVDRAIKETVEWYRVWNDGGNIKEFTHDQILSFMEEFMCKGMKK